MTRLTFALLSSALALADLQVEASCNFGFWYFYPLLDGECNFCVGQDDWCGDFHSTKVECSNDGSSATLYEYDDYSCQGNVINSSDVQVFDCGNTGTCDAIWFHAELLSSDDCSGSDVRAYGNLFLASLDDCIDAGDDYFIWSVVNENVMRYVTYENSSNCTGDSVFDFNVTDERCLEFTNGNSTLYTFNVYDNDTDIDTTYTFTNTDISTDTSTDTDNSGDGSYDGECNFGLWFVYPLLDGECASCSGKDSWCGDWTSLKFECYNSNYGILYYYDDSECNGNVVNMTVLDSVECGNEGGDSCDAVAFSAQLETGTQCNGDTLAYGELYVAKLENYCGDWSFSAGSVEITFTESGLEATIYEESDCTGSTYSFIDIENGECLNSSDANSTQYYFNGDFTTNISGSSESTTSNEYTGDCNYGFWFIYPLLDGECNTCDGNDDWCGDWHGIMLSCSNDGSYATINFYDNTECTGTAINTTYASAVECGNSYSNCDALSFDAKHLQGSDCDGDTLAEGHLYMAALNDYCATLWTDESAEFTLNEDGLKIDIYDNMFCIGTPDWSVNISDNQCLQYGNGNSTLYELNEYTSDGGSSSSSSTSSGAQGNDSAANKNESHLQFIALIMWLVLMVVSIY